MHCKEIEWWTKKGKEYCSRSRIVGVRTRGYTSSRLSAHATIWSSWELQSKPKAKTKVNCDRHPSLIGWRSGTLRLEFWAHVSGLGQWNNWLVDDRQAAESGHYRPTWRTTTRAEPPGRSGVHSAGSAGAATDPHDFIDDGHGARPAGNWFGANRLWPPCRLDWVIDWLLYGTSAHVAV